MSGLELTQVQMRASFDLLKLIKTVFNRFSLLKLSEGDTKSDVVRIWFPNLSVLGFMKYPLCTNMFKCVVHLT
uniref:DUF4283 domain-containing protein n=1 Tax=Panagrellus redivivus TaxID=6233 RepID=A0A7E4W240_PANRE